VLVFTAREHVLVKVIAAGVFWSQVCVVASRRVETTSASVSGDCATHDP